MDHRSEEIKLDVVPAAHKPDSAGHIFRGNPVALHGALAGRADPLMPLRSTLPREQWLPRLARRLADRSHLFDAKTQAACERALLDLSRFNLCEFDVVLLREPGTASVPRSCLAGFNTQSPAQGSSSSDAPIHLAALLRAHFGNSLIAWASELLDNVSGDALLEALFWEALSPYLGHRRTRQVLETFFADINYDHAAAQSSVPDLAPAGNLDGILTLVLRSLMNTCLFERSRAPMASRPLEAWHRSERQSEAGIFEEATKNGLAILTGLPGIGKTSGLRPYDLPRLDARRADLADFKRFLATYRGRLIVIDSFYCLQEALSSVVEACRHALTPLILISRPPADQWKRLDTVQNWEGRPPAVFCVHAPTPAEFRQKIEPVLRTEHATLVEPVDWSSLHEISGGNHRMAWSLLGLGANLGLLPTRDSLGVLCSWKHGEHADQPLRSFGLFRAEWFTDLWDDCRDKLFPFAEAFALLKQIAYHPLALSELASFTEHERRMIQRLRDFDVLQADEQRSSLRVRGEVFAHFLRGTSAERFWRSSLQAAPVFWTNCEESSKSNDLRVERSSIT